MIADPPHDPSPETRHESRTPVLAFQVPTVDSPSELRHRRGWRRWLRALLLRGGRRPVLGVALLAVALSQAGTITWFALATPVELPIDTNWMRHDKLLHALAFGWLAYWTMAGLHHVTRWHAGWSCLVTVLAAGVGWGSMIEVAQSFTRHRAFDLMDILADATGAIIVTAVLVVLADSGRQRLPRYARSGPTTEVRHG